MHLSKKDTVAYIHICMQTNIYTYIQNKNRHTTKHTHKQTYVHTCIQTYIHAHIQTYIHIYIQTSINTNIHTCTHAHRMEMATLVQMK